MTFLFTIFLIFLSTGVTISASVAYNAEEALAFARGNYKAYSTDPGSPNYNSYYNPDSETWECAEFASRSLYAGGLTCAYNNNSPYTRCLKLYEALFAAEIPQHVLSSENGVYYLASNSTKVAAGDPIFSRCNICTYEGETDPPLYTHVVLCAGTNSSGKLIYYARNEDPDATQPLILYPARCGKNHLMDWVSFHIPPSTGRFNFTFYKNDAEWNDTSYGTTAYVINNASNKKYYLTQHPSYAYTYRTVDTLPYGEYTLWVNKGNGGFVSNGTYTLDSASEWNGVRYYTVTYNGNGNTGGSPPATATRLKGQTVTLPGQGTLVRDNYTYIGWVTAGPPYISYAVGEVYTVNGGIILYAQWVPHVTAYITVKRDGTTWTDCYRSMELRNADGNSYDLVRQSDGRYRATNVPQGTYDIYVASDGSSGLVKTGSVTLTQSNATATVNYYTITFNANGGSGTVPATKTCAAGASMSVPDQGNLTKAGHSFCYWISSLTNSLINPGSTHKITGQQVLRAYWIYGEYRLGDVDHDGALTATDSRLILQYYNGKITAADLDVSLADYDQDGDITSTDARLVLQDYVGKTLASDDQLLLNSNGEPITWDDLDWSLLDWDAIDWDNFSFADLIEMLTAGNRSPDHEIM